MLKLRLYSLSYLIVYSSMSVGELGYTPIISGDGTFIQEERQIPPIKHIKIDADARLILNESQTSKLLVEAEQNILPFLIHKVQHDTLIISQKHKSIRPSKEVIYKLQIKNIYSIEAANNAKIQTSQGLYSNILKINLKDNAKAKIWISCNELQSILNDNAKLTLQGRSARQNINLKSNAKYYGSKLKSNLALAHLQGNSNAYLNIEKNLTASIIDNATLYYIGNPQIEHSLQGNGLIFKRG